jgi:GntR family transcriptional regulator
MIRESGKLNSVIYIQIAEKIIESILVEKIIVGIKLPSLVAISKEFSVNRNTAARAFAYLVEHHIIESRRGIGYFILQEGLANARTLKQNNFLNTRLQYFFKNIFLLGISFNELQTLYTYYLKTEFPNT